MVYLEGPVVSPAALAFVLAVAELIFVLQPLVDVTLGQPLVGIDLFLRFRVLDDRAVLGDSLHLNSGRVWQHPEVLEQSRSAT